MTRHRQVLSMEPVPDDAQAVYRRRGIRPPSASSAYHEAATWPYEPRLAHELYARANRLYWLDCVLCTRPHGGHEIGEDIPDPTRGENIWTRICPRCTAERNGGTP